MTETTTTTKKTFQVRARAIIEYTVYPLAANEEEAEAAIRENKFYAWEPGSPQKDTIEIISTTEEVF